MIVSNNNNKVISHFFIEKKEDAEKRELIQFTRDVFNNIIDKNLIPFPNVYNTFFFNKLEEADNYQIKKIIENINTNLFLHNKDDELKDFLNNILELIKKIEKTYAFLIKKYKKIILLENSLEKTVDNFLNTVKAATSQKVLLKQIENYKEKINKIKQQIQNERKQYYKILELYINTLKQIKDDSIVNHKYNIYNRKFFIQKLEKEIKAIKLLNYSDTVIMLKIRDSDLKKNEITQEKQLTAVYKILTKVMLSNLRKTDILSKYDKGVFVILLEHTNLAKGEEILQRLIEKFYSTPIYFIDDLNKEYSLGLFGAIREINKKINDSAEDILYGMYGKILTNESKTQEDYIIIK